MTESRLTVSELQVQDLAFLLELWHDPQVMRYADELPMFRGWSKEDDVETAWAAYRAQRAKVGPCYTQLILHLPDGAPIGESFFVPLPEGFTLDRWEKPRGETCLFGDVKLQPRYWGRGLGTAGMRQVVRWAFEHTDCDSFVVPPHNENPAAIRVYEKAGFVPFEEIGSWHGHGVMDMSRARYESFYGV